jgi:hypothetical protein
VPYFSKRGYSRRGYTLEFIRPGERAPRYAHAIGGKHAIPGATCPCCARPLLLLATLDTRDPRLGLKLTWNDDTDFALEYARMPTVHVRRRDLPLFYCWYCIPATISYRITVGGGVDVLDHDVSMGPPRIPERPDYPLFFPRRAVRLVPIPPHVQRAIRRYHADTLSDTESHKYRRFLRPRHQVGGEIYFAQGGMGTGRGCTLCADGDSGTLAAIADDNGTKGGFVGESSVQVLFRYCIPCQVVSCANECD